MSSSSPNPIWPPLVSLLGLTYFLAWSLSFYPQLILNYRRKRTDGLSADFVYLNPLGFLALSIWNAGMLFSPLARAQYAGRHDGNVPQVAGADLAFSAHAFVLAVAALVQVWYYRQRTIEGIAGDVGEGRSEGEGDEREPLLNGQGVKKGETKVGEPAIPSTLCQVGLTLMMASAFGSAVIVWAGKLEWLDWLYFVSTIKIVISAVKYTPQILTNWRLRRVEGMAIEGMILDLIGAFLSFAQLVISSIFIAHDPSGIIANPAKLGLSGLSASFDFVLLAQKYIFFRPGRESVRGSGELRGSHWEMGPAGQRCIAL